MYILTYDWVLFSFTSVLPFSDPFFAPFWRKLIWLETINKINQPDSQQEEDMSLFLAFGKSSAAARGFP